MPSCLAGVNFNPLFPYGKRHGDEEVSRRPADFNPLFPYGKRQIPASVFAPRLPFQSTLPIREETKPARCSKTLKPISIHSSHTGRDDCASQHAEFRRNFNPLFPYGKRPRRPGLPRWVADFNPLFPYGKRRQHQGPGAGPGISIHSSHTGRDRPAQYRQCRYRHFNPLFPYGKRP